jgi:hypothetical protein
MNISWILVDQSVVTADIEDIVAHELGHYYQTRMNPAIFTSRFVESDQGAGNSA